MALLTQQELEDFQYEWGGETLAIKTKWLEEREEKKKIKQKKDIDNYINAEQAYTKVIVTGHVIEIYRMQKEPVNPWDYESVHDDDDSEFWEGFKHDGTMSKQHLEEWRQKENEKRKEREKTRGDRKLERREQTLRDGRNRVRRLALANFDSTHCLITLTYAEHMTDIEQADKDFKSFIRSFRTYTGQSVKYLAVREFTKIGRIHFHLLVDWVHPSTKSHDKSYIERLERIVASVCWGRGFIDIAPLNRSRSKRKEYNGKPVDNVGAYISKYMTKEKDDSRLKGHKLYLNSQGLEKPKEYSGIEAEEIIKAYKLDIKKEIFTNSYNSEYLGKITYEEYNLNRLEETITE